MSLVGQWDELQAGLPSGWSEKDVRLLLEEAGQATRALEVLGPLHTVRTADGALSFRVARDGTGPGPELARRLLGRLDDERLHGVLELASSAEAPPVEAAAPTTLSASWDSEIAKLPSDWSDLLAQVELLSSDYLDPGAIRMAPINPRLVPGTLTLQFRSARTFGYGASPGMVRRCFERCDEVGIRGEVRVLRALSDTRPVLTQGPVWQLSGRTV